MLEPESKKTKQSSPLYPCSELPSIDSISKEHCLEDLAKYYNITNFLGYGTYGVTLHIERNDHKLAIKIFQKNDDGIYEIKIACKLNEIKDLTSIFTYTHGWLLCNGIPNEWNKRIPWNNIAAFNQIKEIHNENIDFLYLIMDLNSLRFASFNMFSEEDLLKILLILSHGLIMIRKKYPYFRHVDIHHHNIMIEQRYNDNNDVKLEFDDFKSTVIIKDVRYYPKLIDFGLSKFNDWDINDEYYKSDIYRWNNDFIVKGVQYKKQHDLYRIFYVMYNKFLEKFPQNKITEKLINTIDDKHNNFQILMDKYTKGDKQFPVLFSNYLLNMKLKWFKDFIIVKDQEKQLNENICSYCNGAAKYRYEHSNDYQFCSKECADVFCVFKNYFPVKK